MVDELAYSIHLGNDKNKTKRAKEIAETNASGTTSFANSSIQNKQQLSKVNKHNLRDYDKQKDLIYVIVGTESVYKDVQNMYQLEFQQAQEEYNLKQTRDDRKIKEPYFDYVAKSNRDLACELIIELGDMDFWQDKNMDYRLKMVDVYKQQIADLRRIQPNFHIANAVIHFDETSPHMHIVGIPIKEGYKNGMKKQVAKSQIFTKDTLKVLQDKMRACGIRSFNKVYDESRQLKKKKAGRNVDFRVGDEMSNYREFKKSKEANIERLKSTNSKAIKLDDSTDRVRNKLDNLPTSKLNKNKFILDGNDVEELKGYLKEVDDVSVSVKDVGDIQSTIDKYDEYLEKHEKEKLDLRDTIYERDLKIQSKENAIELLNEEIGKKDDEIKGLKGTISNLKDEIEYLTDFWERIVSKFKEKFFKQFYTPEIYGTDYIKVIDDMKDDGTLTKEEYMMFIEKTPLIDDYKKENNLDNKPKKKNDYNLD